MLRSVRKPARARRRATPSDPGVISALVERARSGDRRAFDELVRATYRDIHGLALRLTRNEQDANDVVQEAYVRAYRGIRRFRGEAGFSTWLYRITTNCASTFLARSARHGHVELDVELALVDDHPETDPSLRCEASALRSALDRAVGQLPARLRAVVELRDEHDLSHREIAERLGISESAAKVRLHRARHSLRTHLRNVVDSGELADVVPLHPEPPAGRADRRQQLEAAGGDA